ncbi:PDDEXK nuclease domain-containing protein [Flammeovirga sp. MY04]|uniref:PDDEXK nuclease domain-containing protein n=1 Tax=Flammeovirga sp. MY04 TaxID=1191459 RepID=UPI000AC98A30|nr:PDDEXK nuclease domain-containing protein [Flammeovirga sp. MY04]
MLKINSVYLDDKCIKGNKLSMKSFSLLVKTIENTDLLFKEGVKRTIDKSLSLRNWLFGFYIVEYEQAGNDRQNYGDKIIHHLSEKINKRGFSVTNLKLYRQFYITYPQFGEAIKSILYPQQLSSFNQVIEDSGISQTLSDRLSSALPLDVDLLSHLSFSHFLELIKIHDENQRRYYELEAIKGVWSVRELKKQINKLSYERSVYAKNPEKMMKHFQKSTEKILPTDVLKTPYVFDFLELPDNVLASESKLENALLNDLKEFMLELGHGFCFEAQQKRIVIGGEYFFVDLVFYHRILKCHVLIELKIDEFTHHYAGQLNTYLQYYKKHIQREDDNPPIGILLCTNQNHELVEFALGGMDNKMFVTQYKTELPTKEQLEDFLRNR